MYYPSYRMRRLRRTPAIRRMLREKIGEHAIEFDDGPGLHLGSRDTRESV